MFSVYLNVCVCAPGVSVPGFQGGDSGVGGGWVVSLKAAAGGGHQRAGARLQAVLQQPPAAAPAVTHVHQEEDVDVDTFVVFEGLQGRLAWICDIKAGFITEMLEVFCQISAMILMMTRVLVFAQSDELQLQTQTETNRRLSPLPLSGRISRRHFS